jgi:hypothetical protein
MIEHIAISGAGPAGIIQVGMIQQALDEGMIELTHIKSYHGSSAGAIISLLLCIGVPITEIAEYVVLRPWSKWLKYDVTHFYENKGVVSSECIADLVSPFFHAYNIPLDITLAQLYERTHLELFIYTTNVSNLTSVALHHLTHPDLSAIQSVMMSANIPIIFTPIKYKEDYYIDGAFRKHCPTIPFPEENILKFYIGYDPITLNMEDTKEYFHYLLLMMYYTLSNNTHPPQGNVIHHNDGSVTHLDGWKQYLYEEEYRRNMIEVGKQATKNYLENKKNKV